MKLISFKHHEEVSLGLVTLQGVLPVGEAGQLLGLEVPGNIEELLAQGASALAALQSLQEKALGNNALPWLSEQEITLLPPVPAPQKIICVGLNYSSHTAEVSREQPKAPVLFSMFNTALAAHGEEIPLPPIATKFDYEGELVVVIGKKGYHVELAAALDYVLGYANGNDLTARELQSLSTQWLLGKSLDHFAPMGPYLVTADEVGDPQTLDLEVRVNGEVRQKANTAEMIFSVAEIISYASRHFTLLPGDLIYTGTTGGVISGYPKDRQVWLKAGDVVTVAISKLGILENRLVDEV
ncbi:MAG: fumarylacetoacetate hydrolase family protein [Symbiobacteriaceae bacterium]|nr:fumarylacetoacetate hydrolase family protein [Symbiobacteriaceae bacterium]